MHVLTWKLNLSSTIHGLRWLRMSRSALMCANWFLASISLFFIFFTATISPVFLYLQTLTSPKAPLPMMLMGSKSLGESLARLAFVPVILLSQKISLLLAN